MAPTLPSRSTLIAMAAGAALAVGAGGVAVGLTSSAAADSTPTPAPSASSPGHGEGKGGGKGFGGFGGHRMGAGAVLHGELVVQDGTSGSRTVLVQRGQVTAVTSSSVTAKSSDGFTVTWTVNDRTRGSLQGIATGDQIMATGTKTGDGAATAEVLHELGVRPERTGDQRKGQDQSPGQGWGRHRDGRTAPSSPSPSPTT